MWGNAVCLQEGTVSPDKLGEPTALYTAVEAAVGRGGEGAKLGLQRCEVAMIQASSTKQERVHSQAPSTLDPLALSSVVMSRVGYAKLLDETMAKARTHLHLREATLREIPYKEEKPEKPEKPEKVDKSGGKETASDKSRWACLNTCPPSRDLSFSQLSLARHPL